MITDMKSFNNGIWIGARAAMMGSILMLFAIIYAQPAYGQIAASKDQQNARVDAGSSESASRVAPGDLLPISLKLSNFGGGMRVDALIAYSILDATGREISSTSETVAVETTASFIKSVQIPFDTAPGTYTALTSVTYAGQLTPAISRFSFRVERKILGLFQSDFLLYGGASSIITICVLLLSYILVERRRKARFTPFDYSGISKDRRTFYEILSDTIMQMRQRVGDDALVIASRTAGLTIDPETGRVLALTEPPGKVIAALVSEYERFLGKKVSFSFRKDTTSA